MKRKLQTRAGATVYAQRKWIVEPVFGQISPAFAERVNPPPEIQPSSNETMPS